MSPTENIQDIAAWTGRKFGEFRGYRTLQNNIRILSHTGGFAVFLPPEIWRPLDQQVSISFPEKPKSSCWIADKNFAYVKIDTDPSALQGSDKDYVAENTEVALNKIESFVRKNFFKNSQARPDSGYFTHGSFADEPNSARPFRLRLGGNFRYQF